MLSNIQCTPRKMRELDQIHAYLQTFEMPSWVGRLPNDVGYPAGGSLSTDEYKALVLVYCPVIIPLIWREWQMLAQKDFENATARWEAKAKRRDEDKPKLHIHPQDANNFKKLAAALKIILGRKIRNADIPCAKQLLSEYLHGYLEIHEIDIKPNHHWVTHIFNQILDFSPVYGFWTFTSKRLNKLLKSFTTNNHNGGEIEVSFFRTFCKDALLHQTLRYLAMTAREGDQGLSEMAAQMIGVDKDIRGTVASVNAMVQEVKDWTRDCGLGIKRPSLGTHIMKTLLQFPYLIPSHHSAYLSISSHHSAYFNSSPCIT
ncbi:hypothetical protein EW145_g6729 [Phellinidium pouzarii]|uniref:Uncharacterized protein n=1 Tax=Phellinidium pouzarii TaxID=167371 RepID=A0A4S4KVZ3_9AGAM|nr:hypothetical protein EW145_g6729 [Phellinidium pouzarii]